MAYEGCSVCPWLFSFIKNQNDKYTTERWRILRVTDWINRCIMFMLIQRNLVTPLPYIFSCWKNNALLVKNEFVTEWHEPLKLLFKNVNRDIKHEKKWYRYWNSFNGARLVVLTFPTFAGRWVVRCEKNGSDHDPPENGKADRLKLDMNFTL